VLRAESQTISDMFHLVHGPSFQHGKVIAVIFGYFDESSTHAGSKVVSLCGFLADPRIWEDFDREWKKVLDKSDWPNRPPEFHMYECVHGLGAFTGWNLAERLAIYGDMVTLLCDTNLIGLGSVILVGAFNDQSDDHKRLLALGGLSEPIDLVFQHLIQIAISATVRYGNIHNPPIVDQLGVLFDEVDPSIASRYYRLYKHIKSGDRNGNMLTGISFGDSVKFTPIQAADMLAYTTYRHILRRYFPSEPEFEFPINAPFMRLVENIATDGGVFSDSALMTLIGQILINNANKPFRF
jgi:hypothetical protein